MLCAVPEEISLKQIDNAGMFDRHITCSYPTNSSKMNEIDL
jgi:hypothetical protein